MVVQKYGSGIHYDDKKVYGYLMPVDKHTYIKERLIIICRVHTSHIRAHIPGPALTTASFIKIRSTSAPILKGLKH